MQIIYIYILTCRYGVLCRISIVQVQHRKYVLDHADHTAPPGNMSQIIHIIHFRNKDALRYLHHELLWESIICLVCGTVRYDIKRSILYLPLVYQYRRARSNHSTHDTPGRATRSQSEMPT